MKILRHKQRWCLLKRASEDMKIEKKHLESNMKKLGNNRLLFILKAELSCELGVKMSPVTIVTRFPESGNETSRRILRYGNSFLPTFPEVLLAHASQMTGQLSRSMHIACKY